MLSSGLVPSRSIVFDKLMGMYIKLKLYNNVLTIFSLMKKYEYNPSKEAFMMAVQANICILRKDEALIIFDEMISSLPNASSDIKYYYYSIQLSGLLNEPNEALRLYDEMLKQNLTPDKGTICEIMKCNIGFENKKRFYSMLEGELNHKIWNTIIDLNGFQGDIEFLDFLFTELCEKSKLTGHTVNTYCSFIEAFGRNAELEKDIRVLELFNERLDSFNFNFERTQYDANKLVCTFIDKVYYQLSDSERIKADRILAKVNELFRFKQSPPNENLLE